jgi:hypothetical protein
MSDQPKPPSDEELQAIRDRAEAAVEGPWVHQDWAVEGREQRHKVRAKYQGEFDWVCDTNGNGTCVIQNNANGAFIAHARTDVPRLLALVDWLNGLIADMQRDEGFRRGVEEGRRQCVQFLRDQAHRIYTSSDHLTMPRAAYHRTRGIAARLDLLAREIEDAAGDPNAPSEATPA